MVIMKQIFSLMTLLFTSSAFAQGVPLYLWDNQEALVKPGRCEVERVADIPFKVVRQTGWEKTGSENLRNYRSVRQSYLLNGSIVKSIKGKVKNNYKKIEVVGVNQTVSKTAKRWRSKRLDQGYIYKKSLFPLEDYTLEVKKSSLGSPMLNSLTDSATVYFVVESMGGYYSLECENQGEGRKYNLFRVYDNLENNSDPIAMMGIYWDETKVFSKVVTKALLNYSSPLAKLESEINMNSILDQAQIHLTDDSSGLALPEAVVSSDSGDDSRPIISADSQTSSSEAVENVSGNLQQIVCTSEKLSVRDDSLESVLFKGKLGEDVKVFQSFSSNEKEKRIRGVQYKYIKVEFPNREESDQKVGWVAKKFIKLKSNCKYFKAKQRREQILKTQITGLNDPKCCEFPTVKAPTHSYEEGQRKFGHRRDGGRRRHAGCDLYRAKNEPILAVAPGKVIRGPYAFYMGTYALEVEHSGGFIVRYGEISGKRVRGITKGKQVKMGERIGYVGKLNSNRSRPMLHFELYSGKKNGQLKSRHGRFKRRSDLLDPTPYLRKWEAGKF